MRDKKYYIYNWRQAYFYMKNGVMPIERPGVHPNGSVYFVFSGKDTEKVYDKWCKNKE
ncbi:hypothetical protein [Clostridium baratii]|uniref:hypothetical protein n=1 Tax=Clostridium baratii TaxID=1561 RepID=UPI003D346368